MVLSLALSSPGLASGVEDVTVAVLVTSVPGETDSNFTCSVKLEVPTPKEGLEHETVPVPPTAGVVHDQPLALVRD